MFHKGGTLKGLEQWHAQGTFQGCVRLRPQEGREERAESPGSWYLLNSRCPLSSTAAVRGQVSGGS